VSRPVPVLSYWSLALFPLVAVFRPGRILKELPRYRAVRWHYAFFLISYMTVVDVLLHIPMVYRRWVFELYPHDWIPGAAGYVLFNLNAWLLGFLLLLMLRRWGRGPAAPAVSLALASYYLFGGLTWVIWIADSFHWLFRWPLLEIRLPAAWGLDAPIVYLYGRIAHLLVFPWAGRALWLVCRHVLGWTAPRQQAIAILCAVLLPLAGRLVIEQLPNLSGRLLWGVLGWGLSQGWIVLITHAGMTVAVTAALWWMLERPRVLPPSLGWSR
jgi:hypothetical protein